MAEITGTIRNARFIADDGDIRCPCISGNVYDDAKGRFKDGDVIRTSRISAMYADGVVETAFSVYRVEFADLPKSQTAA
jgi:hypothetical protein